MVLGTVASRILGMFSSQSIRALAAIDAVHFASRRERELATLEKNNEQLDKREDADAQT